MRGNEVHSPRECRALLAAAFPGLRLGAVRFLAEGWDNTAFLVDEAGGALVFRFPRHALGDRLLTVEIALLAAIGARLPLPIPSYRHVSGPVPGFPWHTAGYRLIPGQPLEAVAVHAAEPLAAPLAAFLAALHATPARLLPPELPRFTPASWLALHDRLVAEALPAIARDDAALAGRVGGWWEGYRRDPRAAAFTPTLIHGDLATEHILIDEAGRPSGVIDFGDARLADPALDLAGLPDALFAAVARRLPDLDAGAALRRAAYRRCVPLHAIAAAGRLGRPELLAEGLEGLQRAFPE
ncbi:MAG TPA: phosphotransferase [Thermomicrobiaceae bacterium]|nr:phosphotransferase [Thermomicrobiaceae bacterium]